MSCLTCSVLKISGEIRKKLNAALKPKNTRKHEIFVYHFSEKLLEVGCLVMNYVCFAK